MKQILMVGFSDILATSQVKHRKMIKDIEDCSDFRDKLVKMIKDAGSKFE